MVRRSSFSSLSKFSSFLLLLLSFSLSDLQEDYWKWRWRTFHPLIVQNIGMEESQDIIRIFISIVQWDLGSRTTSSYSITRIYNANTVLENLVQFKMDHHTWDVRVWVTEEEVEGEELAVQTVGGVTIKLSTNATLLVNGSTLPTVRISVMRMEEIHTVLEEFNLQKQEQINLEMPRRKDFEYVYSSCTLVVTTWRRWWIRHVVVRDCPCGFWITVVEWGEKTDSEPRSRSHFRTKSVSRFTPCWIQGYHFFWFFLCDAGAF